MERRKKRGRGPGGPGGNPGRGEKPQNFGKTLKRLTAYALGKNKLRFTIVVVCIILSTCASTAGSLFLRTLIDDYITPLTLQSNPDFSGLLKAILIMGGIYIVGIAASLAYSLIMVTLSQSVMRRIRDEMFGRMQSLPIKYFDTNTNGDIMSRYTNDTDTLTQFLSQSLTQFISSAITVVVVFVSMVSISVLLTVLVLVTLALMMLVVTKIGGKSAMYFTKQQESIGSLNGYIEEMVNGQKVVKVFCYEDESKAIFNAKNDELRENATAANTYANILMPVMGNLTNLQYVLLAIAGGALAIAGVGGLTLGGIVSFLALSRSFSMPVSMLAQQVNAVATAVAGAERIFELMDEPPETDDGYVTLVNAVERNGELVETKEHTGLWAWKHPHHEGGVTYTQLTGDVRLFDVDFGYSPDKLVLHDVSVYAEPGQKVAFVGATGAGKTTITNLINRFYDIADGKIRYDGININKIKKSDLRRSLGIVLQDVNLFTGTVRENIRYGRLDATDEEIINAAKQANAHDFIMRLPNGYDTMLEGDGSGLSQGQRQLLSIARCAVADPPVMILDEATSSIDTRTEAIVQRGMDQLMHGRTVFVIAHRLSTVQNSDVIMVLDQGRIIERGSHEKLIAERGKYYQLYTGAFELE